MTWKDRNWLTEIDEITRQVEEAFSGLDSDKLNRKPNEETWSIAQNLEHLITLNETYFPAIDQMLTNNYQRPWHSRFRFLRKMFGHSIMKYASPDRTKKMKTMAIWEPGQSDVSSAIISRFAAHQKTLKAYINKSGPLLDLNAVIASPANNLIVYDLEKAFDILVAHEWRHLNQARKLLHLNNQ